MHDKVYEDIAQDKKLYDLQRQKATELLELQAHNFVEKQKKNFLKTTKPDKSKFVGFVILKSMMIFTSNSKFPF